MKFTSSLISAGSGKLGGAVFSHGRNGQIMRRHAIPTQPRTSAQRAVRNQLAALSAAFRNLGASTIAGWNALASGVTRKSKLGTSYHPTGQQLYVSCGKNLANIGIAIGNMSAPTIPSIPVLPSLTMTQPPANSMVTTMPFTWGSTLSSTYGAIISASSVQSSGRTFIGKSEFRKILGGANASTLVTDMYSAFTTRFGLLPYAGTIQFQVKYVDPASGFAGPAVTVNFAFQQQAGANLFTFTLAAMSATFSVATHTAVTSAVTYTANSPFTGAVTISASGLPTGMSMASTPASPTAAPTVLTFTGTPTAGQEGSYVVAVKMAWGSFSVTQNVTLVIGA